MPFRQMPQRSSRLDRAGEQRQHEHSEGRGPYRDTPGRRCLDAQGARDRTRRDASRQPKNSSERTRANRSTGRWDGQARAQSPQSMQEAAWRVTLSGESSDRAPSRAP
jgi:hypothetical protein